MITGSYFIEIPRIRKLAQKPRFLSRVFSPQEIKFLMEKHFPVPKIAEMFAAKCAYLRALGISGKGSRMTEISVLTDYGGAYYISLSGNTKKIFALKRCRISVSCSHTRNLASAIIIFYD